MRTPDGQPGMEATYWNNTSMSGRPVCVTRYASPVSLDNGGNTVFAPGVELTNFTLRLRGSFVAERDEQLTLPFAYDDGLRIIVNSDTIQERWKATNLRFGSKSLSVRRGERYDVQVDYLQLDADATLHLDVARVIPVSSSDVVASAIDADVVIFVGGISGELEREEASVREPGFDNGDRSSIELPQVQRDVLRALHEAGKRVVFVCMSGSAIALEPEVESCDAILQAWYPGEQGGHAIADVLFGDYNPSGKLPVTFYRSDSQLPSFDDYSLRAGQGRTYRYFSGSPLFPFGYGLSYTSFVVGKPEYDARRGGVVVKVSNVGGRDGAEVVQVYVRDPRDAAGPVRTLRAFERVELRAGESRKVFIPLGRDSFRLWDESSQRLAVRPGVYDVFVGVSSETSALSRISVKIK